ncbi:MAG: RluA family pseudouridine synthase [Actinobacteria bacterium]|nr:RluA family pseudouridine synthase [bacterium]MBU1228261.1 RluA family pseudouridine synthase [Actinomycetota bacterium]MBU1675990.1 RluA family pseudouridine synthase [bacterium]
MSEREPTILFEDNHLLAVVKPAGLLVQGDSTGDPTLLTACKAYLKEKYRKPGNVYLGLVHRLDRPVSGVVLLARTSKAASRLSAQFRGLEVRKTYLAMIEGGPRAPRDTLTHHLAGRADAQGCTRCEDSPFADSREARLSYRTLAGDARRSLVLVEPATGRRHQIRAQFAAIGSPIAGDVKYGAAVRLPDHSIALHAWQLECAHPVGGAPLVLSAPPPEGDPWPADLAAILAALPGPRP